MNSSLQPSIFVEQQRLEAILKNKNATIFWQERKQAFAGVQKSMEHYAGKLQEQIMVPIGKRGLMRGKIVNTNQVFVSLGSGWFTKVCSAEAQKVCSRRISECNDMLDKLEKERQLFEGWTALYNKQVFATEDSKEIIEPYDEKEEEIWRKQHAVKVKEHRKKLIELREKIEESKVKEKTSEEELWRHLDLLELQEEFEDELDRISEDSEDENNSSSPLDSDDDSYEEKMEVGNEQILAAEKPSILRKAEPNVESDVKQIIHHSIDIRKTEVNKKKSVTKKVSFDESTYLKESSETGDNNKVDDPRLNETVVFGQVIERSTDMLKSQSSSQETRPISKFKSSKKANKK